MAHTKEVDYLGAHRLIPEQYSDGTGALEKLNLAENVLREISELDMATNERKLAERSRSTGIGLHELVFGVPEANIVNAAFTHSGPHGGRFHTSKRGAWYAGIEFETSVEEVVFHRRRFLQNVQNEKFHKRQTFHYVDFLADFRGRFHHLEPNEQEFCLQANPVPACYRASQDFAQKLLLEGSLGIVYQSVRHPSGMCIACFRPALVSNPRRVTQCQITLSVGSNQIEVSKRIPLGPSHPE